MKRTIIIIVMIIISIIAGYVYELVSINFEKRSHPIKYEEYVERYAAEYGIPKEIVYSVINVESGFSADVESHKGAVGLMQITPVTFDWLMTKTGEKIDIKLLYDPETNIKYGTFFLRILFLEFENWELTFAAYNAGRGKINEWMKNPEYIKDGVIISLPYKETSDYIVKVNRNREVYKRLYFTSNVNNNINKSVNE